MEHFLNPRNMGKVEDANGVGKVGNVVCLLPNQNIHINNDLKVINKISTKDEVLSHDGQYNTVRKTSRRNYNGRMLSIKNCLGTIALTPDHLVLAIKIPKGDWFLRTKNKKGLIPSWYHAKHLKRRDITLYPIPKEAKDTEYLKIDISKPKWDFRSIELPKKIPLDSDLLRLFGYFLSEGNVQDKRCNTFVSFTLNILERDIVEDIRNISKKLFGLDVVVRERPRANTVSVCLYSARLARFFKHLFDNGAEIKSIPDFIMKLPVKKQKSLLYGLWKGDGYVNIRRDGPRAGYSTISYKLAQQIKILLLRQKIVPSIYKEAAREVGGVRHRKAYRIHVGQRDSLVRLCSILGMKYEPVSFSSTDSWFDSNYLYTPITKIERRFRKSEVHNLEVDDFHSFTSEAFCLHNCGDVMVVYIRVKNDVIENIGFETFGCASAIATSSMVTELAKGKTLDEALEIGREDVADALEGLPPIKLHCSNLAADGLHEAIYDYLVKSGKPISKELENAHVRIVQNMNQIEHRHGGK